MKWLFGWPVRGPWRPWKPSRVILRGFTNSKGRDHRLIPAVEVEVGPELALEVHPELTLGVDLEVMPGPTVKVTP